MTAYAELAVTTSFSFLRGASQPAEMVAMAAELGLAAIGIADRNSLAGVVRAYGEARRRETMAQDQRRRREEERKRRDELMILDPDAPPPAMPACDEPDVTTIQLLVGARLVTIDGFEVIAYPTDRGAYGRLCRLLSEGNLAAKKGECRLTFEHILAVGAGQVLIALPPDTTDAAFEERLAALVHAAPRHVFLAGVHRHRGDEPRRLGLLAEFGQRLGAPMVAVNDVHYHDPGRRPLADIVTCIREKCTIHEAGLRLSVNAERHLKPSEEMARLFADFPVAVARTMEIISICTFSLGQLRNEYPDEPVPPDKTPQQHLADLTWEGARERYPSNKYPFGVPEDVAKRLKEELALIAHLKYWNYFLTVHDIVAFARDRGILCQGRGSAANSAVCYCLGITSVDPAKTRLLFARFLSENRREPPDIDVDFEHERREEVIQYIYDRYGRDKAAICATVIHYRSRRAIREAGKALGLTPDVTAALAKTVWGVSGEPIADDHIRQAGLDPANPAIRQALVLAHALRGFPRHLSQHVGGFILTRERLDETVPIGNGAMADRTFIEWDKDDIDTLGLMKVDVLALGMLSCLRRGLDLIETHYGKEHTLASLISDDEKGEGGEVYAMLSQADSVGVFQVESRAQMSMLPRLKPSKFYDLVIEVAIVRPGPIQGDMVHPYLRRRDALRERGEEPNYPRPAPPHPQHELKDVLERTLGVPLFQEQAMQIAITAAEFSPAEADGLRRAMATFRHMGTVQNYREPFITGMTRRGYDKDFATSCFNQIEGFGEYGFPESHAASFALLVYVSAWIKCHHPDVFCAAILNSQPMGFYQPAQLVRDARQHGVEVREVDVNDSQWDCILEGPPDAKGRLAVRLGFRMVQGLNEQELGRLIAARGNGYRSVERLGAIGGLSHFAIERLAEADTFRSMGLDRRQALWAARRLGAIGIESVGRIAKATDKVAGKLSKKAEKTLPLFAAHLGDELFQEPAVALPAMGLAEHVVEDYVATGLSLKAHPVGFFRERLTRLGAMTNASHRDQALPQDMRVTVAGLVLMRQMPGTAKGVVFATLEDETGIANIIVWPKVFERHRITVMTSRFLAVRGRLQRAGLVVHVIAESFVDLSGELARLADDGVLTVAGRSPDPPLLKSRDFH